LPFKDLQWSYKLQEFTFFSQSQIFIGCRRTVQVSIKQKFFGPQERASGKGWKQGGQFLPAEEQHAASMTRDTGESEVGSIHSLADGLLVTLRYIWPLQEKYRLHG